VYEHLQKQPEVEILRLMGLFREDSRDNKVDLGIGVYRNAAGVTPIMRAIKEAEKRLWADEETKGYTQMVGEADFRAAMRDLVLADSCAADEVAAAATPGGTGAIRQGLELIGLANTGAKIWVSMPTWPNHPSILDYLKCDWGYYRYFDEESRAVDFAGMLEDLNKAAPGDIVLLHGCCHNPTGANLSVSQWRELAGLLVDKRLVPFVDIAYQGFGDGLDDDAFGTRELARTVPELLIAASCSKNFGIYRERTGILLAVAKDKERLGVVQDTLAFLNRQAFSFPPDHGSRLVTMILNDTGLRADWEAELSDIRHSLVDLRKSLADALRDRTGSDRFGFLAEHRGMFSLLGATREQVAMMRDKHAVYMIPDSRINVAGLSHEIIPRIAEALVDVGI